MRSSNKTFEEIFMELNQVCIELLAKLAWLPYMEMQIIEKLSLSKDGEKYIRELLDMQSKKHQELNHRYCDVYQEYVYFHQGEEIT
jgi:hypothetical protein